MGKNVEEQVMPVPLQAMLTARNVGQDTLLPPLCKESKVALVRNTLGDSSVPYSAQLITYGPYSFSFSSLARHRRTRSTIIPTTGMKER